MVVLAAFLLVVFFFVILYRYPKEVTLLLPSLDAFGFADIERPNAKTDSVVNGRAPESLRANITRTAELVSAISVAYSPGVRIVSGYRSQAYNDAVQGKPQSLHLVGKAVDIMPNDGNVRNLNASILEMVQKGDLPQGGIGLYRTFLHYDWRGYKARWGSLTDNVQSGDNA